MSELIANFSAFLALPEVTTRMQLRRAAIIMNLEKLGFSVVDQVTAFKEDARGASTSLMLSFSDKTLPDNPEDPVVKFVLEQHIAGPAVQSRDGRAHEGVAYYWRVTEPYDIKAFITQTPPDAVLPSASAKTLDMGMGETPLQSSLSGGAAVPWHDKEGLQALDDAFKRASVADVVKAVVDHVGRMPSDHLQAGQVEPVAADVLKDPKVLALQALVLDQIREKLRQFALHVGPTGSVVHRTPSRTFQESTIVSNQEADILADDEPLATASSCCLLAWMPDVQQLQFALRLAIVRFASGNDEAIVLLWPPLNISAANLRNTSRIKEWAAEVDQALMDERLDNLVEACIERCTP